MAFAGIWQDWRGPQGTVATCAIVTCPANALLAPIHDRMPVVIAPDDFGLWLGEAGQGAARLMVPAPDGAPDRPADRLRPPRSVLKARRTTRHFISRGKRYSLAGRQEDPRCAHP